MTLDDLRLVLAIPNQYHVALRIRGAMVWLCCRNNEAVPPEVEEFTGQVPWTPKQLYQLIVEVGCKGYHDSDPVEDDGNTLVHELCRLRMATDLRHWLSKRRGLDIITLANRSGHAPLDISVSGDVHAIILSHILKQAQADAARLATKVSSIDDTLTLVLVAAALLSILNVTSMAALAWHAWV